MKDILNHTQSYNFNWSNQIKNYDYERTHLAWEKNPIPPRVTTKMVKHNDLAFDLILQKYADKSLDNTLRQNEHKEMISSIIKNQDKQLKVEQTFNIINLQDRLKGFENHPDYPKQKDLINKRKKINYNLKNYNILSNLPLTKNQAMDSYKNFCNYAKTIFTNNKNIHYVKELWALLSLFFDSYTYNSKTKDKISVEKDKIDIQIFEILLYGFRFCANSLYFKKNEKIDIKKLLFPSILTKDCKKIIDNSLIPGIDDKEDLHVFNLESIQFHLNNFADSCGCYVCSCGIYYNIDPCGFPTSRRTFKCQGCGKDCGWGPKVIKDKGASNHGMIIREGHYRIFKDKAQKVSQMSRWNDPDENIPNKLYEEYSKEVYEKYGKNSAFGFNSVDRDYFEKQDKKIRKLSSIGYRLLNFISYSHLFFSYCLDNIKNDELNQYLIRTCNILKIIQIDWDFLKEDLQKENIGSIQIFLNMIFKDLSKLIRNFKITKNDLDRENFEIQVEELIKKCMEKYHDYSEKYKIENKKQSDSDINSFQTFY